MDSSTEQQAGRETNLNSEDLEEDLYQVFPLKLW